MIGAAVTRSVGSEFAPVSSTLSPASLVTSAAASSWVGTASWPFGQSISSEVSTFAFAFTGQQHGSKSSENWAWLLVPRNPKHPVCPHSSTATPSVQIRPLKVYSRRDHVRNGRFGGVSKGEQDCVALGLS